MWPGAAGWGWQTCVGGGWEDRSLPASPAVPEVQTVHCSTDTGSTCGTGSTETPVAHAVHVVQAVQRYSLPIWDTSCVVEVWHTGHCTTEQAPQTVRPSLALCCLNRMRITILMKLGVTAVHVSGSM